MKRVVIIGASGYLGGLTSTYLKTQGYEVIQVSRSDKGVGWKTWGESCIEGADVIINFAGKPVNSRWTPKVKKQLLLSRVEPSDDIVRWIENSEPSGRPSLYLCASGIGIFGDNGEQSVDDFADHGDDFLAQICKKWEASAAKAEALGVRVVSMRFGAVLGKDSAAWKKMSLPYRWFVGGKLGNGSDYFSWIHEEDAIRGIQHCIESEAISGGVNFSAVSLPHSEVAKAIGHVLKRPSLLFVPKFALRIAVGEFAEALLASINATSKKLDDTGYRWSYPRLKEALIEIEQ